MTWTTRPRCDVAGLAAIVAGAGPEILMIHGVGLRAEAWNAQITALAPQYRVTAVDMPGHGQSALAPEAAGLEGYVEAVAKTLDQPAIVIGHSMGAMIALDLAIRHPDKVTGVAALNAIFQRSAAASQAVKARANSLEGTSAPDSSAPLARWFGDALSPARDACETWLSAVSPKGYKAAYQVFAAEDGPEPQQLSTLACPALFMTGGAEPNSTPEMSRNMAALAPQARAHIIANAAHMMPMTHATEVNAELERFAAAVFRT